MWCTKCQADVAAEMAPDNRRVLCASCGSQIRSVPLSPTEDKTRQARELLERWSKNRWSEEADETREPVAEPIAELTSAKRSEAPPAPRAHAKPAIRRDESHPDPGSIADSPQAVREVSAPRRLSQYPFPSAHPAAMPSQPTPGAAFAQRTHDPHEFSAPPPHFPGEPLPVEEPPVGNSSSKLQAFWGQMLAYLGVLALTVGAAFVLLGYFGGPQWQSYTPTGWLITTTGQMLLFLGVVTLVSGGMEQTTEEVARRIDKLGQRMIRIEWASRNHALKGPSVPAERFSPDGEEEEETGRRGDREEGRRESIQGKRSLNS